MVDNSRCLTQVVEWYKTQVKPAQQPSQREAVAGQKMDSSNE